MGYKEQLKQVLNKFTALKDTAKNRIEEIIKSQKYSEEYKAKLIEEIKNETKVIQDQLTKEALEIIQEVKNQILGEKTEVTKDQSFDLKLSNTLKILEMAGSDMTIEELKVLVRPFEKDYHTMQILRTIFNKGAIKGVNEIFGYNTIDSRIKSLDELERTISHAFFGDIEKTDTLKVLIALNYMSEV